MGKLLKQSNFKFIENTRRFIRLYYINTINYANTSLNHLIQLDNVKPNFAFTNVKFHSMGMLYVTTKAVILVNPKFCL